MDIVDVVFDTFVGDYAWAKLLPARPATYKVPSATNASAAQAFSIEPSPAAHMSAGPGLWHNIIQFPFFLLFTDFFVYMIHRGLHHQLVYKTLHKPHHKWIMPTPYASHAFHPLDGFEQSIPYHVFPFLLPLQKVSYVALFVLVNLWTILIHDGEYVANNPSFNGAACHTLHHYFNYNHGQYTTLWDRLGGSYRRPNAELFREDQKMSGREWNKQVQEMGQMIVEVEGKDDRTYDPAGAKKNA
ncbi:C-5 sterol desaturase desaturase [Apiospora hydei]|uniref:C-5 sterol desaturase desaturase n=1 Tax=Apiospora hydei TaxID=1337664 RepID=A0ABR1X1U5_9PEZI